MKRSIIPLALILAVPAAADQPATVTLTQDQLQRLIQSETSKAIANYVTQSEATKAKDVYDRIQKAFTPNETKPPEGK